MKSPECGSSGLKPWEAFRKNIRGLPRAASWGGLVAGILVVVISSTGPLAILFQAAKVGNFSAAQTSSWLLTIFVGSGIFGLFLSLRHGMPIVGAWASATTALLVTALTSHSYAETIGAYFVVSLALILVGVTGIFQRLISLVPHAVVMAMLSGILFRFGIDIFTAMRSDALLGISMVLAFFIGRRFHWRAPVLLALAVGLLVAFEQSLLKNPHIKISLTHPIWSNPEWNAGSLLTLALPIFLMVMTTQNAPGIAVLRNSGFKPPVNQIVTFGGALSLLGAGFGSSGVNLSTITAAIATGEQSDPNPKNRYFAGVCAGISYLLLGLVGATVTGLFASLPATLLAVLAGLALLPVIGSATYEALSDQGYREAGLVTLLITISGVSAWNLGSPFWGLVGGVLVHHITSGKATSGKAIRTKN